MTATDTQTYYLRPAALGAGFAPTRIWPTAYAQAAGKRSP
jgi:hypothetical protein